jgi:hypothetical protein
MSITARIVIVAFACSAWACTTSPRQTPTEQTEPERIAASPAAASSDDAPLFVARQVIVPTEAMLRAALSNDPDAMREAAATTAVAGCQASSSCPAQFGSCTNWSTPALCNETCGTGVCICRPVWQCDGEPPEPRGTDTYNAYRICFDAAQHACTEFQQTQSTFCGC